MENNAVARGAVGAAIRTHNLTRIGISLHTLEDSFAHAEFNLIWGPQNTREHSPRPDYGHADSGDQGHRADTPSRDPAKANRATAAVLSELQSAYSEVHGVPSPRYHRFDIRMIQQDVDFAIHSGALPANRDATDAELNASRAERIAAWRAIIKTEFGDDVLYEPSGPPAHFRSDVDAHVREVISRSH